MDLLSKSITYSAKNIYKVKLKHGLGMRGRDVLFGVFGLQLPEFPKNSPGTVLPGGGRLAVL